MRSKNKLCDICIEIYEELYKKSKPSANFRELMRKGVTTRYNWFMKYYLEETKQQAIIDRICKKHKCTRFEKDRINEEVALGCSPRGVK